MIGNLSVRENVALSCLKDFARHGVVDSGAERPAVREMTDRLRVRMAGQEQTTDEPWGVLLPQRCVDCPVGLADVAGSDRQG